MKTPKVTIAILNWNNKNHLEQFLPSILNSNYSNLETLVIDNASTDDSIDFLEKNYAEKLQIKKLDKNGGYVGGYNLGLKNVESDYYILINSDVEVPPNWIQPIIDLMESDEKIAACQPKIKSFQNKNEFEYAGAAGGYLDRFCYPFCRGRIFDLVEKDRGNYNDNRAVFWASGACMFVKTKVFWEMGGLDENFFAHMEEIDLCWRMQNAGYKIFCCGESEVFHVGGGSLTYGNPFKTYLNFRNSLIANQKNLPFWEAVFVIFARLFLDGIAGIKVLLEGNFGDFKAIIKAHFHFYAGQKKWIQKRKNIPNKKSLKDLDGIYPKSIIWASFIKGKKRFSELF